MSSPTAQFPSLPDHDALVDASVRVSEERNFTPLSPEVSAVMNHFHTLDVMSAPITEPAVLSPFWAKGDCINFSGPPGCGKTTLAADIIIAATHPDRNGKALGGLFQFDFEYLGDGNIVVIDAENNQNRWASLLHRKMEREGLNPGEINRRIVYVRPSDVGLQTQSNWETSTAKFSDALAANRARFVIGDSLGRIWSPEDINSAGWVQRAFAPFRTACQQHGITSLMLTHTSREASRTTSPQGPIGSSFQDGQADGQIMISRTKVNGRPGIKLLHRKSRRSFWIQQSTSIYLTFTRQYGYEPQHLWETTWPLECPDVDELDDNYTPTTIENIEQLLKAASPKAISTSVIAEQLGISPRTARSHLSKLSKSGCATKEGNGPSTNWRYKPQC